MSSHSISTLEERRIRRGDVFAMKAASNPRFAKSWFPERQEVGWNIRNRRTIQEVDARSTRLFRSPLAYLKRRINDLGIAVGRDSR